MFMYIFDLQRTFKTHFCHSQHPGFMMVLVVPHSTHLSCVLGKIVVSGGAA